MFYNSILQKNVDIYIKNKIFYPNRYFCLGVRGLGNKNVLYVSFIFVICAYLKCRNPLKIVSIIKAIT